MHYTKYKSVHLNSAGDIPITLTHANTHVHMHTHTPGPGPGLNTTLAGDVFLL